MLPPLLLAILPLIQDVADDSAIDWTVPFSDPDEGKASAVPS